MASSSWERVKIATRLAGERREQLELGARQRNQPPGHLSPEAGNVEDDVAGPDHVAGRRASVTAQDRAHASDELTWTERLGHVVVGTQLEADHLVGLVIAGGEHDDRDPGVASEATRHLEPVEPRKPEVQHDQVGALGPGAHQCLRAIASGGHRETRPLEVVADELHDLRLIVDDEDA